VIADGQFPIADSFYHERPIDDRQFEIGTGKTHPLPRGGTDLMSLHERDRTAFDIVRLLKLHQYPCLSRFGKAYKSDILVTAFRPMVLPKLMPTFLNMKIISCVVILLSACLMLSIDIVNAQSTDIATPLPVRTNEVTAAIVARDLGDARLTDHFYAFTGTPGDLLITVDTRNMNGDVDVFTAVGLRPLLKFTVYAGGAAPITKSIYLRQRQDLILRVEARTPNDDDAVYRIHFGGAFEAIAGPLLTENENNSGQPATSGTRAPGKKGRRVSSVGARIEEPPETKVATTPSPEPTPAESAEATEPETPKTARNSPTRPPARGSKRTVSTKPDQPADTANAGTESPAATPAETPAKQPAAESKPAPRRRGSRRGTTARKAEAAPEPEPNTGPRLVIETNDGTLIEHYMSAVRRVTVENGLVVIVGRDGKIERVLLANVVRMSIAP
jgi:hypothetical protein